MAKKKYNSANGKRPPYKNVKKPAPAMDGESRELEAISDAELEKELSTDLIPDEIVKEAPVSTPAEEVAAPAVEAKASVKGGSLSDRWSRFRLTSWWRLWISIPFVIVAVAIIVFGVFAGQSGTFEGGINIGIDFKGGTIITTKLGADAVENDYDT